jgi:hypothetical protein
MSITCGDLCADSLRLIGVLSAIDPMEAEDGNLALRTLNEMMDDWASRQIDLGWSAQSSFSAQAPVDDDSIPPIKYMLALTLAPYYGREPAPSVIGNAQRLYMRVLRKAISDLIEPVDITNLPMPIRRGFYDVTAG